MRKLWLVGYLIAKNLLKLIAHNVRSEVADAIKNGVNPSVTMHKLELVVCDFDIFVGSNMNKKG